MTKEIRLAIDYGHFLLVEDLSKEREAARKEFESIRSQDALSYLVSDGVAKIEEVTDQFRSLDSICHAVVTDMMIGDQPEGLSIALKALAEGIPCVVVSCGDRDDIIAHLPKHVRIGMRALEELGVPVFLSNRDKPKRWREGFEKAAELLFTKWFCEESPMGEAVRRRTRFWARDKTSE